MSTERWRPRQHPGRFRSARELEGLGRRFEDDFIRPVVRAFWERVPEEVKGWSPSIDVYERDDNFEIKVELPGMRQDDIDLSLSEDTLVIKGERRPDRNIKDEDYYRSEITYGSFYRSIALPANVDAGSAQAVYEDGVLRVSLKRPSAAKRKKVNIQGKKETA